MTAWALVPARGGSKSIVRKNLASIAGVPLLAYGVTAAQASERFARIICSTDDDEIAGYARSLGVELDRRPASLATDDARVADMAQEFLARNERVGLPDIVVLIQPTSPFLLPEHIARLIDAMNADPSCKSGQTITPVPHNHHAWNQRVLAEGRVSFRYQEERSKAYNKQRKEPLFVFGNLVAARTQCLLQGGDFFAEPSVSIMIKRPYDLDIDDRDDLALANAIMSARLVRLPHMDQLCTA